MTAPAPGGRPRGRPLSVDLRPHPLTAAGREAVAIAAPPGATVADAMALALPPGAPAPAALAGAVEAALDGRVVPPEAWDTTPVAGARTLAIRAALAGGDSDPLRAALQIAVLAAAMQLPLLAPASWGLAAEGGLTLSGSLASAAILTAGTLVANAVAPMEPEPVPAPGRLEAPAEQYALAGGANRARPYGPMLLVLGAHRVFPDLAAREYTEFRSGEQFLSQLFSFGIGDLEVSDIRVGDTPLDSFDEVAHALYAPAAAVTLVHGAVAAAEGAALPLAAEGADPKTAPPAWTVRTTAGDTTRIAVDLVARLYDIDRSGAVRAAAMTAAVEWRAHGAKDADPWTARAVALSGDSQAQLRHSERWDVPAGQYDVRVRIADAAETGDARRPRQAAWTALRSYRAAGPAVPRADWRLAVDARASGQLSGRLDRLSALAAQKVPVWTPGANGAAGSWSADTASGRRASSNPAAVFRAFARGWRLGGGATGRPLAGSLRAAADIDDAVLGAWHEWCEAKDLRCDYVLDRPVQPEEAEALIARCGRAAPSWATGKLGVVWEDAGDQPTMSVTPERIVAGSMAARWANAPAAEEISARFVDPEAGWTWSEARRLMPGVAAPAYTAAIQLPGVTRAGQAAQECNLQAARQLHHRRRLEWEMGADGAALARGDVVWITHDLVSGGRTGRFSAAPAASPDSSRPPPSRWALRAERPHGVPAPPGSWGWLLIEAPDGALHTARAYPHAAPSDRFDLWTGEELPAAMGGPADANQPGGAAAADWTWRFYAAGAEPLKARIVAVEPRSAERVRVHAIDEVAAYHAAADLPPAAPLAAPGAAAPRVLDARVAEELVRVGAGYAVEIALALTVAGDWRGGDVRARRDGGPWRLAAVAAAGADEARWLEQPAGTLEIAIVPGSLVAPAGPAFRLTHGIRGFLAPPGDVTGFRAEALPDGTRRFRWTAPPDADLAGVAIRYQLAPGEGRPPPDWDAMRPLHEGLLAASPFETFEPPRGAWVFAARARDTGGRWSEGAARLALALGDQRLGPALVYRCEPALGWPGAVDGHVVRDAGGDADGAIEGVGDYTWDDLDAADLPAGWAGWTDWQTRAGSDGGEEISYATPEIDLGVEADATLRWSGDWAGAAAAFEWRGGRRTLVLAPAEVQVDTAPRKLVRLRKFPAAHGLPAEWMAAGVGAQPIHQLRLGLRANGQGAVQLQLGANGGAAGQELAAAIESGARFSVTLTYGDAAGRETTRAVSFGGPAAAGSTSADDSEPYSWVPAAAEAAEIAALLAAVPATPANRSDMRAELAITGVAAADWTAVPAGAAVRARRFRLRWRVTGDGTRPLRLANLCWSAHAPAVEHRLRAANTSEWPGAAGARRVPTSLARVLDVRLSFRGDRAGWGWALTAENPPTVKIVDAAGNPADAVVDASVRGLSGA